MTGRTSPRRSRQRSGRQRHRPGWATPAQRTKSAVPRQPITFPTYTQSQLRRTSRTRISPLAHAIASRLLPVKSSAPATTTSTSPRQNPRPPKRRVMPKPSADWVMITVEKIAPMETNAPASTPSTRRVSVSVWALATPPCGTSPTSAATFSRLQHACPVVRVARHRRRQAQRRDQFLPGLAAAR
jgi:hypothetical protein